MLYKESFRKCKYEETLRICTLLDSGGDVSYDAASEYGGRSHTYCIISSD